MQLTTGRMGKLEIIGKSDADKESDAKIRTNIPTEEDVGEDINVEEEDTEDDEI
mgnify:FL=1